MIKMTNGSMYTKEFDKQINDLMLHALDFSFDKWHEKKVWDDDYERYSIFDNHIMIANISVYKMKMLINGEKKDFLQLGSVATREEYRRKGLSRKIMEHIFEKYPDTPAFLHGSDSVVEFYPKFGFKAFKYKQPYVHYELKNNGEMIRLDISNPKVDKYLKERNQHSQIIDCLNQYPVNWFHLIHGHSKDIYEVPQLGLMIIARQKDNKLTIYDIVTTRKVTFQEVVPYLSFSGVNTILFRFNPDWLGLNYSVQEFKVNDSNPFIKGDFGIEKDYMIPGFIIT